jgi:hypothetical protein
MGFSLAEAGQATGLTLYSEPGALNSKEGMLLGFKRGFLIGVGVRANDKRVAIMARFKAATDADAMLKALKSNPDMKTMYTLCDMGYRGPQMLLWTFNKPMRLKAAEFSAAVDALAETMSTYAQPFDPTHCEGEMCNAAIETLTLANGIPNLMCERCKARVAQDLQVRRQEYERRSPNYSRALLYGTGAAIAGGVAAALFMYFDGSDGRYHPKLFVALAIGVALVVSWAVKSGVRNVSYAACALAAVLSAIGIIIADTGFFSYFIARGQHTSVNRPLIIAVTLVIWKVTWEFSPLVAILHAGTIACTPFLCWGMRPKFKLEYKSIPLPAPALERIGTVSG